MKLFTKYNRINLALMTVVFIISSIIYYYLISYLMLGEVDETLLETKDKWNSYINQNNYLPPVDTLSDVQKKYKPVSKYDSNISLETYDKYDSSKNISKKYRKLVFFVKNRNEFYRVCFCKQLEGRKKLSTIILYSTIFTLLFIILTILFINTILLKKLWKPFYGSIGSVKNFIIGKKQKLVFPETDIEEFVFMNRSLRESILKAEQEYVLLKEFTENASHEIQTPLAIIRSKLDTLIQDDNLTNKQSEILTSAYTSIKKLSRLNQSLLLITKISNQQFEDKRTINLRDKIEEKTSQFNELWVTNNIHAKSYLENSNIIMNEELVDILLNNLLSNATKHNIQNGEIIINLKPHLLSISNTGNLQKLDTGKVFTRFYKESVNSENNGLGLSIIKQICESSSINIEYHFTNNFHNFHLVW